MGMDLCCVAYKVEDKRICRGVCVNSTTIGAMFSLWPSRRQAPVVDGALQVTAVPETQLSFKPNG